MLRHSLSQLALPPPDRREQRHQLSREGPSTKFMLTLKNVSINHLAVPHKNITG